MREKEAFEEAYQRSLFPYILSWNVYKYQKYGKYQNPGGDEVMIKNFKGNGSLVQTRSTMDLIRQVRTDSRISDTPEKRRQRLNNYIKVVQKYA